MRALAGVALLACALALAACAVTREPGWTGDGAEPFDRARAECDRETVGIPDLDQQEDAFEACMASRGWTRPPD